MGTRQRAQNCRACILHATLPPLIASVLLLIAEHHGHFGLTKEVVLVPPCRVSLKHQTKPSGPVSLEVVPGLPSITLEAAMKRDQTQTYTETRLWEGRENIYLEVKGFQKRLTLERT